MNFFLLTEESLSVSNAQHTLNDDGCGGTVIFIGTVRNQSKGKEVVALEFEAYQPMVISELEKISTEIESRWPIKHVLLYHRTGHCNVGDIPVIAAIASAHRKEAFEACAYLMDRLKQTVPIWKKEIFSTGEEWVSNTP